MGNGCSASGERRVQSDSEYETDDDAQDTTTERQQTPLSLRNVGATATPAAANSHAAITAGGKTQNVKPASTKATSPPPTAATQPSTSKKTPAPDAAGPPVSTPLQPTSPAPSNHYVSPKGRMQNPLSSTSTVAATSATVVPSHTTHAAPVPPPHTAQGQPSSSSSSPYGPASGSAKGSYGGAGTNPLHPGLSDTAATGTLESQVDAYAAGLRPTAPTPPSVPIHVAAGGTAAPRRVPALTAAGQDGTSARAATDAAASVASSPPFSGAAAAAMNRSVDGGAGSSTTTQQQQQQQSGMLHSSSPKRAKKEEAPPPEDICVQLPRRLQLKAIRSVTLTACSRDTVQPSLLQPAVLFGALGDMRGERLRHPHQFFSLRKLISAGPVILRYRLSHLLSQVQDAIKTKGETPKKAPIGYGSCVKEPVFALWMTGPPLIESPEMRRRTETSRMTLQKVGMYAVNHYMPCTLRKGSRRRQRGYFECQREVLSVFTHGADQSACFIANFLPDIFVNLQTFDSNVRKALAAAVKVTFHKLYDVLVDRDEALQAQRQIASGGGFGYSDGGGGGGSGGVLRAPRVDVSAVYIRDDALYAASTVGGTEGQLFSLLDPRTVQIISLESDSQLETTSGDDRSLSSRASFVSDTSAANGGGSSKNSSSTNAGRKTEAVHRKYDVPDTMVYRCQLSQFVDLLQGIPTLPELQFSTLVAASPSMNGPLSAAAVPRMAMFQPSVPTTSSFNGSGSDKVRFVVVLSTEAFWQTLSKQTVWELLYLLVELDREASQTQVSERSAADVVRALRAPNPAIVEDVVQTLARFYLIRREAHREEIPCMVEPSMAQALVEIAENQAIVENPDRAARMSVTVIALR